MREVNGTMKYQIEKAVADIGVKVFFGSVEGVDNTGRNPEWEAERKVRLENLQKRFGGPKYLPALSAISTRKLMNISSSGAAGHCPGTIPMSM